MLRIDIVFRFNGATCLAILSHDGTNIATTSHQSSYKLEYHSSSLHMLTLLLLVATTHLDSPTIIVLVIVIGSCGTYISASSGSTSYYPYSSNGMTEALVRLHTGATERFCGGAGSQG